jgi:hypothetical protein
MPSHSVRENVADIETNVAVQGAPGPLAFYARHFHLVNVPLLILITMLLFSSSVGIYFLQVDDLAGCADPEYVWWRGRWEL